MGDPSSIEVSLSHGRHFEFPQSYGDNKVVLMVRDPWTFYAYWEIRKEVEASAKEEIKKKGLRASKSVLRVYDVTETGVDNPEKVTFDLELKDWANSWYVHINDPGREWIADVGIICDNGEFFCLARSNAVRTPSNCMSDICDEDWMCPEEHYHKLFEASGGHEIGKSSLEMRESVERYLRKWLFSGGVSSGMFGSASHHLFKKK
jgi:hypothetical protein